jgi:hypothetical protein
MQGMAKVSARIYRIECMKFKVGDVVMSRYNTHTIYKVLGTTEGTVRVGIASLYGAFNGLKPMEYKAHEEYFYLLTAFDKLMYNIYWEET